MLREPKQHLIKSIVAHVPRDLILSVLATTMEIQSSGGMPLVEPGDADDQIKVDSETQAKKVKTAGGAFLTLIKKHPRFTTAMKKRVFKSDK